MQNNKSKELHMEEQKLDDLYNQCLEELNSIGINMQDKKLIGNIDIKLSTRSSKRYGCCKQENPDKKFKIVKRHGFHKTIHYEKFQDHHIEISKWVMQLNNDIIKNTIMHELIHCIPFCNNHGKEFKKYAKYINKKLGYSINTRGNAKEDFQASNLTYEEQENYKYKIVCEDCGQTIYRKRFNSSLIKKYRCGKCKGKLKLVETK